MSSEKSFVPVGLSPLWALFGLELVLDAEDKEDDVEGGDDPIVWLFDLFTGSGSDFLIGKDGFALNIESCLWSSCAFVLWAAHCECYYDSSQHESRNKIITYGE